MFCSQCGKEVTAGQLFCPSCGNRTGEETTAPITPAAAGRTRTPWEDRERNGFFGGLMTTLRESLFSPTVFFRKMGVAGGIADPLLYAMIVGVVGIMVSYVWQVLFHDAFQGLLPSDVQGAAGINALGGIGLAFFALLMPFFFICLLFLTTGMLHLLLLMVRGANNGFEATFRTIAYSCGSCIFFTVPFCGGVIATVWGMVIAIIGLKEAHGTSGGKASFAVLFPLILCCVMAILFTVLVLGTVAASFGTMRPSPWK